MELEYNTRDGNGNDIVKKIPIKEVVNYVDYANLNVLCWSNGLPQN